MTEKNHFQILNSIDVNGKTEKKKVGGAQLTYLSWSWAWAELKKKFPYAVYKIERFEGKPYLYDDHLGYMVFTDITIGDLTHSMWLPVLDGANKAMKATPYTYEVKGWDGKPPTVKTVNAATMFDINTSLMRCLVKNISMFGLGLYIYAGEDLPEAETEKTEKPADKKPTAAANKKKYAEYVSYLDKVDSLELWQKVKPRKDAWVLWSEKNYGNDYANQLNDKFLSLAALYEPIRPAPSAIINDELPAFLM